MKPLAQHTMTPEEEAAWVIRAQTGQLWKTRGVMPKCACGQLAVTKGKCHRCYNRAYMKARRLPEV